MKLIITILAFMAFSVSAATEQFGHRTGTFTSTTTGWQKQVSNLTGTEVTADVNYCWSCGGVNGSLEVINTDINTIAKTTFSGYESGQYSEEFCKLGGLEIGSRVESGSGYMDAHTVATIDGTVDRFYGEYAHGYEKEEFEAVAITGKTFTDEHEQYSYSTVTTWRN